MNITARRAVVGVFLAIAITSTMDATGLFAFSALPLLPLGALLWWRERLPRKDVGLSRGTGRGYALAVLYPVAVIGIVAILAVASGAADLARTDWPHQWMKFVRVAAATIVVAILTEEGFFRGWLWASLERAGLSRNGVLIWTSVAFASWHWSAVCLKNGVGFDLPSAQIPVFLVNAAVMGAGWGLLRRISGSIIVSSVSHGIWNGLAYVFFGFGTKVGALGVRNTALFGPEVGVLGLAVNTGFVAALWWWSERGQRVPTDPDPALLA